MMVFKLVLHIIWTNFKTRKIPNIPTKLNTSFYVSLLFLEPKKSLECINLNLQTLFGLLTDPYRDAKLVGVMIAPPYPALNRVKTLFFYIFIFWHRSKYWFWEKSTWTHSSANKINRNGQILWSLCHTMTFPF